MGPFKLGKINATNHHWQLAGRYFAAMLPLQTQVKTPVVPTALGVKVMLDPEIFDSAADAVTVITPALCATLATHLVAAVASVKDALVGKVPLTA